MAIRFKIESYRPTPDDPIGRTGVGYFPRMTEAEAWEAGSGTWKVDRAKADREQFALVVGADRVLAITRLSATYATGDARIAFEGELLTAGHPLYERYIGQPDPLANGSRNPIAYGQIDGEEEFLDRGCACGCGTETASVFAPGHDHRAVMQRVRDHFDGSILSFIRWVDAELERDSGPR
ncbi:hypothetical protein F4561_003680 [Lipingzhangella halophila]|uniref:Uncharacterized protein n=1 Tax=Lipingzhangella halophila TaxID=1783352 RepID=A0A7W7RJ02_9ACTN|nr:hypothetical protein [Lipingzhangella halophila]MBB4932860.1 hypothetical protein [Lipingzhangella halophila]